MTLIWNWICSFFLFCLGFLKVLPRQIFNIIANLVFYCYLWPCGVIYECDFFFVYVIL